MPHDWVKAQPLIGQGLTDSNAVSGTVEESDLTQTKRKHHFTKWIHNHS